jgi:hypothetical protein
MCQIRKQAIFKKHVRGEVRIRPERFKLCRFCLEITADILQLVSDLDTGPAILSLPVRSAEDLWNNAHPRDHVGDNDQRDPAAEGIDLGEGSGPTDIFRRKGRGPTRQRPQTPEANTGLPHLQGVRNDGEVNLPS